MRISAVARDESNWREYSLLRATDSMNPTNLRNGASKERDTKAAPTPARTTARHAYNRKLTRMTALTGPSALLRGCSR